MSKSKKLRCLIKSAKMGKPLAMYRLGIKYQLGRHLPQDMGQACFWITQAADFGNAEAVDWLKDYGFDDNVGIQSES